MKEIIALISTLSVFRFLWYIKCYEKKKFSESNERNFVVVASMTKAILMVTTKGKFYRHGYLIFNSFHPLPIRCKFERNVLNGVLNPNIIDSTHKIKKKIIILIFQILYNKNSTVFIEGTLHDTVVRIFVLLKKMT